MANTKQARKRARQMVVRNMHLSAQRSQFRTAIKAVRKLIIAGDKTAAQEAFKKAESVIDAMARKGVLHANAAAHHKSPLAAPGTAMASSVDRAIRKKRTFQGALFFMSRIVGFIGRYRFDGPADGLSVICEPQPSGMT